MKRIIAVIFVLCFCFGLYIGIQPDDYSFYSSEEIKSEYPFVSLDVDSVAASKVSNGKYRAKIKLFGVLPIKNANVSIVKKQNLVPLGKAFGVKLYTKGVIVVDITDFLHDGKIQNPAFAAGVREGDVILSYNGVEISSNEQLLKQVSLFDGSPQPVVVQRNNLTLNFNVTPVTDDNDGDYRIGLWVRDSTAGLGMLTFYNPSDNTLVGLGHSISDTDTGQVMPVSTGELVSATIGGVVKGVEGKPGELLGTFVEGSILGVLTNNSQSGLSATCVTDEFSKMESVTLAHKNDIETGYAQIISCVDGQKCEYYDIEIVKKNNNLQETKNMVIKITDQRLLDRTGGIVQGMSGSPIIQNGKLVGAVTHVFVDDPTRGYGIFIENMLDAAA